jgi:hypothetical protein
MMPPVDDRAFLAAFESCALPAEDFHHRDHVRVAWLYLHEHPPAAALARFAEALRRFADAHGHPGLYHETITWAYLLLIHERRARSETRPDATFEEFAAAHPDLFTWKPSILATTGRRRWARSWRGGCLCCRIGGRRPYLARSRPYSSRRSRCRLRERGSATLIR